MLWFTTTAKSKSRIENGRDHLRSDCVIDHLSTKSAEEQSITRENQRTLVALWKIGNPKSCLFLLMT